jgi:H+-transporting ATPase
MGSMIVRGEVEGTVDATGKNTFFGKTASLLQGGKSTSNLQKVLNRIMIILVTISFVLCFTAFGYLMGYKHVHVKEALSFTVVLIVASIPIAIEIVCTTTLALGSKALSKEGAIVSRLNCIEEMAGMNMLCSDKTGTLTLNKMVIQEQTPVYQPGLNQYELLRYAAMAAKWKEPPRDALDTLVLTTVDIDSLQNVNQVEYMPFDPTIKRTEGTIREPDGSTFKVTKGAPHIILKLIPDDPETTKKVEEEVKEFGNRGIRCLAVAKTNSEGKWQMLGLLTFLDPPRPDTKETIDTAKKYGVQVKMITGDHLLIAKETARALGLGHDIQDASNLPSLVQGKPPPNLAKDYGAEIEAADGFAQVYPEHKYLIVECLRKMGYKVGMTGDGVNDAPALKRADVGVAVSGATDAARAAADIVLTQPGLSTIVKGIVVSRTIFGRMKSFITYRIAATLQLLVFFFIAVLTFDPTTYEPTGVAWPEFFQLPVLLLMLITLLNDGTLISIGYDNVKPSASPEKWNLITLFIVSSVLGGVACLSSLLLLWCALDSWNPDGVFMKWGIGRLQYGQIITMVFLKVAVSDFLTLFSARTHGRFFFTCRPSWILLAAGSLALSLSTILANVWPNTKLENIPVVGLAYVNPKLMSLWVWLYCIIVWFIQDTCKVLTFWIIKKLKALRRNKKGKGKPGLHEVEMQPVGVNAAKPQANHV